MKSAQGFKLVISVAVLVLCSLALPVPAAAQGWSNGYAFRRTITIDHTKVANTDQTNFPVLVTSTYSDMATTANSGSVTNSNGYDIIFTSDAAGSSTLSFEQEAYNPSSGAFTYWVKIPTVSHTTDTTFYLFYGNSSITTDQSNKTGVWDSNFVGVWHLPNGSTLTANDSTSNGFNGAINSATATSGQIGGAANFSGSTNISVSTTGTLSGAFTVELWAKPTSAAGGVFGSRTPSDQSFDMQISSTGVHGDIGSGGSWINTSADASFSYTANTWHHFVYVVTTSGYHIYGDGAQIGSGSFSATPLLYDSNHRLTIGGIGYPGYNFSGAVDEVHVSNTGRSPDWIATEYKNQSSSSAFVLVGTAAPSANSVFISRLTPISASLGDSVTIQGGNFGANQGSSAVSLNGVAISPQSWSDAAIGVVVPASATSGPFVVTVNGTSVTSPTLTVRSIPSGWSDSDIGTVGLAGTAAYSNGAFSVQGSGSDINGTADSFHFLYQPLIGDGTIVARLASFQGSGAYQKAGVMIRETLAAGSSNVFVAKQGTGSSLIFDYRTATGGSTSQSSATASLPYWVKLVRSGNSFSGYTSSDGVNWTQVGSTQSISMAQSVYIGLALVSNNNSALATASFDGTSINSNANAAPSISNVSETLGHVGDQVNISGLNFGATQGNSQVLLNGAATTINSWSATSLTITIPAGATSGNLLVTVAPSMNGSNPVYFKVTTLPAGSGWLDQDIGNVGLAGNAGFSNGVFTVQGAGNGYAGGTTADAFHFVYQALTGDGTIVARIASISNSGNQAGVLMRETLDPGSKAIFMSAYGRLYYRATSGSATAYYNGSSGGVPYWYKLVRSGSLFTGYVAADGVNWTQVGASQSINMAQTVYVGFGMSSASTGSLSTATFDNVSLSSAANSAPVITSISSTNASVGSQVVIGGLNFGATQGNSQVLLNGAATTINSWSATSISVTIPSGATSGYLVVSVAPSMNNSNPVSFTVGTNPLPPGWLDQDVGYVGLAGSASFSNGVYTVTGGGNGNGSSNNTQDGYHFAYQSLSGDGTIIARVVSATNGEWPGVMMRESLSSGAKSIFLCECNGTVLQSRSINGGTLSQIGAAGGIPYWLKLVRIGTDFISYVSPDGVSWAVVGGSVPISMAQDIYVGLAVTSNNLGHEYPATFDSVSVSSSTSVVPMITSLSATTGPVGTQVIVGGSGFGASQGSSIVTLNDSPVTVNLWSDTSIAVTIPAGATSGYITVLRGPGMNSSNGVIFTVTSSPLPSGWFDQDIGPVSNAGSATYSGGVFTVQGSRPGLHFVYQPIATDFTIVARVTSLSQYAQGGVMIRQTLDANSSSASAFMYAYGNPPVVEEFDYRKYSGGPTYSSSVGSSALGWVKLARSANTFSAFSSSDGISWTPIGTTQTIPSTQTVYAGILSTTGSGTALGTATIDNVSITLGSSLPNPTITGLSKTSGAPGSLVTISGSGFGNTQGASTANFNGVASSTIYSWSDTQIQAAVPDGATSGPVTVVEGNITSNGLNFTIAFAALVTDSLGNQTSYNSSLFGGQWAFTDAQGSGCSSCTTRGTVHNQYDGQGNPAWTVDALGHAVVYRFDSSNNLISQQVQGDTNIATASSTYTYNSLGEPLTVTDPLGNVTTNVYDTHGNLTSVTTPAPNGSTAASVTRFAYNTLGELTSITDPLNHVTTLTYTPAGLIATITDVQNNVTTYGYDSHGNRTSVTDALNHQTTFAYDAGDRLTTITYPGGTTTTFGYDYRGRRTSVTDQNSKTTTYAYDDADRLTSVTDAANHTTMYAYDTENNLTSITDANNNQTTFTYDTFGRVTQTNFPSSHMETYTYDANNNLTSKTDRKGQTIQYVYDVLNRMTRKLYQDSTEVDYVYDLVGKIQQVNDPTGTYAFAYDNMGRLIGTTTNYNFLPSKTFTNSYTYDAASNRTGFTDPESGSTAYAYDTLNRLQTLTPPAVISSGSFGFSYDALSRRTQMTRPNNVTTNYGYDNLSRLLSVLHQMSGSTIDGTSYTVDSAGNRAAKTDGQTGVTTNYGYDSLYQLLSATQGGSTTESYGYDPVGNRLSSLGVSSYTNNSSNELTATSNATYGYDLNGNAVTKNDSTGITTYAWDFENRLTSVTLPGTGGAVTFKYDPFGRRIYKSSSSGTSVYAYDGDNPIEETNAAGTAVARYSQGLNVDEPLAMLRSSTTSFYQVDGLGSVTSLSNAAGALAQTYGYDSFGKQTSSSGSLTNPFQYTARESDTETGLYYNRARYYDPSTGRFVSEDESQFAESSNFYSYVGNDPTNLVDDSGYRAKKPDNLPLGTPKKYWKPFARGLKEAQKRLNNKKCAELFEPSCHEGPETTGFNQMKATEYRFLPLPEGKGVGAATFDSTHVVLNTLGLYLTATNGRITLPDGSTFDLGNARNVQAMILLHELGHELSDDTGFVPDLDAATNAAHTKRIIDACFQKSH